MISKLSTYLLGDFGDCCDLVDAGLAGVTGLHSRFSEENVAGTHFDIRIVRFPAQTRDSADLGGVHSR